MEKSNKFPSPSGALMFLTKIIKFIRLHWQIISVPFRGFDVSNPCLLEALIFNGCKQGLRGKITYSFFDVEFFMFTALKPCNFNLRGKTTQICSSCSGQTQAVHRHSTLSCTYEEISRTYSRYRAYAF